MSSEKHHENHLGQLFYCLLSGILHSHLEEKVATPFSPLSHQSLHMFATRISAY